MNSKTNQNQDRLIRAKELRQITGISPTSRWRYEKAGAFPQRVRISSGGAVAWKLSEVMQWMDNLQKADDKGSYREAA